MKKYIVVEKKGYYVTFIQSAVENAEIHKLRHEVFSKELNRVPYDENEMDIDEHDFHAKHLALFDPKDQLIGTVRLVDSSRPWIIENNLSELTTPGFKLEKGPLSAEVTKLAIRKGKRNLKIDENTYTIDLLMKGLFIYASYQGYMTLYTTISDVVFEMFKKRGICCEALGAPNQIENGMVGVATTLNMEKLLHPEVPEESYWSLYNMVDDLKEQPEDSLLRTILNRPVNQYVSFGETMNTMNSINFMNRESHAPSREELSPFQSFVGNDFFGGGFFSPFDVA